MQLLRRTVTLRITAPEGSEPRTFDALVILPKGSDAPERIRAQTPYIRALPDCDATIVVTGTEPDAPLEVAYEVMRRGRSVLAGRSWWPIAVLERRGGRIVAAGIGGPSGDHDAGRPADVRAI